MNSSYYDFVVSSTLTSALVFGHLAWAGRHVCAKSAQGSTSPVMKVISVLFQMGAYLLPLRLCPAWCTKSVRELLPYARLKIGSDCLRIHLFGNSRRKRVNTQRSSVTQCGTVCKVDIKSLSVYSPESKLQHSMPYVYIISHGWWLLLNADKLSTSKTAI